MKWVKVSGENVRKAAREVDTSLKAADEGFCGTEDRREGSSWHGAFSFAIVDSRLLPFS